MLTLIIIILVISAISAYLTDRPYKKAIRKVALLKEQGDLGGAADVYLELLDKEYSRRIKRCHRITYLTDSVRPLLEYAGRTKDERRILERSMKICITNTRGRSWERWMQRLALLDETKDE